MDPQIIPVPLGRPTFLDVPRCDYLDALDADLAIIALPYNWPYTLEWSRAPSSTAPDHIRAQSQRLVWSLHHYDFDYGRDIFAGRRPRIVDCGDVFEKPGEFEFNGRMATGCHQEDPLLSPVAG